jgi:phage shock protein A
MGIFSRFSDIVNSNLNAILDKAEDPEKMVRLMIQEMEDTLVEVRSAAARSIADKKELTRKVGTLEGDAEDWSAKAELAVTRGRDDLAKAALAERTRIESTAEGTRAQLRAVQEGLTKLNDDISRLEAKLADAKAKQRAMVTRHQTASRQIAMRSKIHDNRIDDALLRFEQYERKLDDVEGRVEAYDLGSQKKTLHDEFASLESEDRVELELKQLKERMAQRASSGGRDEA